jgi:hypothetical protein
MTGILVRSQIPCAKHSSSLNALDGVGLGKVYSMAFGVFLSRRCTAKYGSAGAAFKEGHWKSRQVDRAYHQS